MVEIKTRPARCTQHRRTTRIDMITSFVSLYFPFSFLLSFARVPRRNKTAWGSCSAGKTSACHGCTHIHISSKRRYPCLLFTPLIIFFGFARIANPIASRREAAKVNRISNQLTSAHFSALVAFSLL